MEIPEMPMSVRQRKSVAFFAITDRATCGTLKDNEKGGEPVAAFSAERYGDVVWQV